MAGHPNRPVLDAVSLRFLDDFEEEQYTSYFATSRSNAADKRFWTIGMCFHCAFAVALAIRGSLMSFTALGYTSVLILQGALLHLLPPATLVKHRTLILIACRLAADTLIGVGLYTWLHPHDLTTWASIIFIHIFIHSGILSLNFQAWSNVLPIKYAAAVQAVSALLTALLVNDGCCSLLTQEPLGMNVLSSMWRLVLHTCTATFALTLGRLCFLDKQSLVFILSKDELLCHSTLLFFQVTCGYALPLLVLYVLERRDRALYWSALHNRPAETVRVTRATQVVVTLLFVVVVVCTWEMAVVLLHSSLVYPMEGGDSDDWDL
jgi:hypothetical protein